MSICLRNFKGSLFPKKSHAHGCSCAVVLCRAHSVISPFIAWLDISDRQTKIYNRFMISTIFNFLLAMIRLYVETVGIYGLGPFYSFTIKRVKI